LIAIQSFEAFGLHGFAAFSKDPDKLTNNGHDIAFGGGVRLGWYGDIKPWLSLGAAYSSKIYMQKFDNYTGALADGRLDIPANYSVGAALKPNNDWIIAIDVQRTEYGEVNALANSVLNSLAPGGPPLGSKNGSAFGWKHDQTNYRLGLTYFASTRLTFRAGYAYGKRPHDEDLDATTLSVLTPNPIHQASVGLSWKTPKGNELHLGFAHYFKDTYRGPSGILPGAMESVEPYVNTLHIAWTAYY
jgi:long-chain fatty acid transport protein